MCHEARASRIWSVSQKPSSTTGGRRRASRTAASHGPHTVPVLSAANQVPHRAQYLIRRDSTTFSPYAFQSLPAEGSADQTAAASSAQAAHRPPGSGARYARSQRSQFWKGSGRGAGGTRCRWSDRDRDDLLARGEIDRGDLVGAALGYENGRCTTVGCLTQAPDHFLGGSSCSVQMHLPLSR